MNRAYFNTVFPGRQVTDRNAPGRHAPDSEAEEPSVVCPVRFWATTTPDAIALRTFVRRVSAEADVSVASEPESIGYKELDELISKIQDQLLSSVRATGLLTALVVDDAVATIIVLFACLRAQIPLVLFSGRVPESVVEQSIVEHRIGAIIRIIPSSSGRARTQLHIQVDATDVENPTTLSDRIGAAREAGMKHAAEHGSDRGTGGAAELSLDIPATLVYTSGSTAKPSLAVHSVRNHLASANAACERMPLTSESSWLMSLGLNHVGGLGILFRCFMTGTSVAIVDGGWSPAAPMCAGVTHASVVPTQLLQILDARRPRPEPRILNPVCLLVGGGAASDHLIREAVQTGFVTRTTYGLTEFASQVATSDPWTDDVSDSFPLNMLSHVNACTHNGILSLKGESLFLGYLRNGHLHPSTGEDGYFSTGDLAGIMGSEISIEGRSDLLFISGGENIQPAEIEFHLLSIQGIEQAAVVAVPDATFGMRPVAFLKRSSGSIDQNEINSRLREVLPGFKIPDHYYDWPAGLDRDGIKFSRQKMTEVAINLQPVAEKSRRAPR